MAPTSSPEALCRKNGVILTCYVDGRKLFRAVRSPTADDRSPPLPAPRAALAPRPGGTSR